MNPTPGCYNHTMMELQLNKDSKVLQLNASQEFYSQPLCEATKGSALVVVHGGSGQSEGVSDSINYQGQGQ